MAGLIAGRARAGLDLLAAKVPRLVVTYTATGRRLLLRGGHETMHLCRAALHPPSL
jgi:hypothetical protein